ncbi:hypothetical protein H5125_08085 [Shewanella sp. SR44-4]|uniref:hypothetical protein n=1 Tax=Shewanella sp. SR44-4 TaxID=2760935 RepID=UPI0016010CDE|nr:hypothetical protein [Shewanella sp. SR44-4]MBB1362107.1 hypothetical protein [Shewanella sp. SR44-4]
MDWKSISGTVGTIAGAVAPLLGGPIGLAVSIGSQIAGALGTENTPEAVQAALRNDPNAALKLQEWAAQEREQIRQANIELQRIALDEYKADLADRQNARSEHKDHWMPATLTLVLLGQFSAVLWALFYGPEIEGNRDLIVYLVGNLFTLVAGAVTYWVSSTKESSDKDKLMGLLKQNPMQIVNNKESS